MENPPDNIRTLTSGERHAQARSYLRDVFMETIGSAGLQLTAYTLRVDREPNSLCARKRSSGQYDWYDDTVASIPLNCTSSKTHSHRKF